MAATEKVFRETTVAEMLSQPGSVTPLCEEKKVISLGLGSAAGVKSKSAARNAKKKRYVWTQNRLCRNMIYK